MIKTKKLSKSLIFFPILGILFSCGSIEKASEYSIVTVNNSNSIIKLSESEPSSGEYYGPNDVELSYTISSITENDIGRYTYLENNINPIKILVVPIHFSDSKLSNGKLEEYKADIDNVFNGINDNEVGFKSVKDFYNISSYGKINLEFDILDFYNSNKLSSLYTNEESTKSLINDALNYFNVDRRQYDGNNDGFIDAVFAIYDVNNYNNNSSSNNKNLWAYTYHSYGLDPSYEAPALSSFTWASYDFMFSGYNDKLDPHTYIHELGHLFGLYDYYDYNSLYSPLSGLDMMEYNIMDHNQYSKMILDWIKPYVVYGNATINVNELKDNHSCIVILSDKKDLVYSKDNTYYFNPFSEYILIEPFTYDESSLNYYDLKNGYNPVNLSPDSVFTTDGYRMYHVDKRLGIVTENSNGYTFELYDSHIPNYDMDGKFFTIISNTSNGESKKLGSLGLSTAMSKYKLNDYFNEINLIAKKTEFVNSYNSLFIHQNEDGQVKLMPISNDYLFMSGDTFNPRDYSNYFVNGGNDSSLIFNSGSTFSSSVIFE